MIVWGGTDGTTSVNTGGRYNPSTDVWTATSTTGSCPSARNGHTAVWTGTEMIVWGGSYLSGALNTGGRYNPTSDSWITTSGWSSLPSARSLHTSVWTGNEMIVWGGWDGIATFFQSGGRYNPATDAWTATSTLSPCPVGRRYQTAIWTGSNMIVWGGSYISGPNDVPLNSGGMYDPAGNSWTQTDLASPPAARHRHTAVWASMGAPATSVMIVWGGWGDNGAGGNDYLNSGALFDPVANTWTAISTTSAPTARYDHTAVWTGTQMIIWGGENGGGKLNTGGRYDLALDSWPAMAPSSLTARSRHSAVWSPELSCLIIWGGTGAAIYNTGARYYPNPGGGSAGNLWKTMSATLAPTARYDHTAVWTGQEMIVWGGYGTTPSYKSDGGRYNPYLDTWTPAAGWPDDLNAPVSRSQHGSVWSLQKEMVIWGGAGPLVSGGVFVPPPQIVGKYEACGFGPVTLQTATYDGYQWLKDGTAIPGATSQTLQVDSTLGSAVYNVTVTLPGGSTCEGVDHRVDLWGYPTPTVLGDASGCHVPGVVLSTQTYSYYQWNLNDTPIASGGTSATYTATATGDYSVTVTDSHGCQGTSPDRTITIYANPAPTVAADAISGCAQLLHTQSFVSYQWWIGTATTPIAGATSPTYSATANGAYGVTVVDSNGCSGTSTAYTVKVQPNPTIGGGTSACEGNSVTLTATPGTGDITPYQGYWWIKDGVDIPGANGATYDVYVSGVYTVRVADANGCLGTSTTSKTVTIYPLPQPAIQGDANPSCSNVLSTTSTYSSYQWIKDTVDIPGATTATYTAWVSGSYQVRVADTHGCVNTSGPFSVTIYAAPQVAISGASHGCSVAGINLVANGTNLIAFQWILDGVDIPGATSSSYVASDVGFHGYSVRVTESVHSCQSTSAPFWANLDPPRPDIFTQYNSLYVTNGTVNTVLPSANTLYVGGAFTAAGPLTGPAVAIDATGALEGGWPKVSGTIYAVLPDGSGGWFIGGSFTKVGGYARTNLAHILSDKSIDPSLAPGINDVVYCLARSSGILYIGGAFATVSGQTRNRLAQINLSTGQLTSWNPNITGGTPSVVYAIALSGTTLYAGGTFTTVGYDSRNKIAAIDASTGLATSWNPNASSTVYALALSTDGSTIYAGGAFTTIGGQARNKLATLNASDALATTWNPNLNGTMGVRALALVSGQYLYAAGDFTSVGGSTTRNRIAEWDMTQPPASNLMGWNPSLGGSGTPIAYSLAVATSPATIVYAGGYFTTIGGTTVRNRIAAIDTNGSATAWDPNVLNGNVYAIVLNGTEVFAGGDFSSVNAQARSGLAAFDLLTGAVTSWNPTPGGATPTVYALALSPDFSTLYAGGAFTTMGGQTRNRIASVSTSLPGSVTTWNPNATSGQVNALAVSSDGATVYAGGTFTNIGGQTRNRLAALNMSDGLATTWNPNAGNTVRALLRSGSELFVGGDFTTVNGSTTRNRLAAYDLSQIPPVLFSWNPNAGNSVYCMAVSSVPDTLYVGGTFTTLNAVTHNYLGVVKISDGTPYTWNPSIPTGAVYSLSVSLDGASVYAGGTFTTIGGQARNRLAELSAADATATSWNPNVYGATTPAVNALALAANGSVLCAGGNYTDVSSSGHQYISALPLASTHCNVSLILSTQVFGAYQWYLDGFSITGATASAYTTTAPGTYTVTVTGADSCSGTSSGLLFNGSNPQPVVTGPASGCAGQITLTTDNFANYQWLKNSVTISGATSRNFTVTDVGTDSYSVAVTDSWGCSATSPGYEVTATSCGTPEVSPSGSSFPARLTVSGGVYTLHFSKVASATAYNIYQGTIGSYYSHSATFLCNATVTDLGNGEMTATIVPAAGNHYYLVTAVAGGVEGPSGYNSQGQEIDPSQSTCAP